MCGFRRLNSTSKRVLDLLEPADSLESCDRRITVVKFRMVGRGGNGAGCFEVTDTAKFVNVIIARFRKCSDLIREGKVFVKNTTKVASRVGCSERGVVYFRKLLFKSNKKKFSFRRVESEKIGSHPGRDLLYSIL